MQDRFTFTLLKIANAVDNAIKKIGYCLQKRS